MPMREDCKHFESRSYPNGDTVASATSTLAPEAPSEVPRPTCPSFQKRRIDVNWSHGSLVTPATPDEPQGLGDDDSIAALLDAAEDIINEAVPGVIADLDAERGIGGKVRKRLRQGRKGRRNRKGRRRR